MNLEERFEGNKKRGLWLALGNGHAMTRFTESKDAGVYSSMSKCAYCHAHLYVSATSEHPTEPGGSAVDNRCPRAWYFTEYKG